MRPPIAMMAMKRLRINWAMLRRPSTHVSCALAFGAVWVSWPFITFRTYPHVTWRAYAGMLLMTLASSILRAAEEAKL